ncbi:MAG TPA: beta-N-acetylglucosaminidase domain-containing protein [Verrucomicrobiae bacterium]|jgi:hypothetical protein|nr:beta-N-acetylglucosaminidase domain-containing protein [Verrucomicrobiae bacterium]
MKRCFSICVSAIVVLGFLLTANASNAPTGFAYRGIKGWCWTPEQYLEEIPHLREFKMNFLMNCYGSMYTSAPGEPWKNEWWKPMTHERKLAYSRVIEACRENGITFCFAFHPQIFSPRPLNPESAADTDLFFQHYAWAQAQGVHWFSVSLDDVSWDQNGASHGGAIHAKFVNTIFSRLRAKDPSAQLIFCPGPYWGDGRDAKSQPYLEALGKDLHPDVYIFWTGDGVTTQHITLAAAESYKSIIRHRLFLWDNYPVNDGTPTLHLGPLTGRDPGLCKVIDGYISNPMATQNELNRLPLATCADYAVDPLTYNPDRSLQESIDRLATTQPQREVLKSLVALYPGFLATGGGTGANPVRDKFKAMLSAGDKKELQTFIQKAKDAATGLARQFPNEFVNARKTVEADIAWMNQQISSRHFSNP